MDELRAKVELVHRVLVERAREAKTEIQRQVELLEKDFVRLVSLARIDRPIQAEISKEGEYLKAALVNQIREAIAHLLEARADLAATLPLHRLRSWSELRGPSEPTDAGKTGVENRAEQPNLSGSGLHDMFPASDPRQGWLIIRKFPEKRAIRPAGGELETPQTVWVPKSGAASPVASFEADLGRGSDLSAAVERYLEVVRAWNGVLPIKVRNEEEQRRLRQLEAAQIAAVFASEGLEHLVVAGRLEPLRELVTLRDEQAQDPDKLWPLAALWYAAVADPRLLRSNNCLPQLGEDEVRGLNITLPKEDLLRFSRQLRLMPPNAFIDFFSAEEILAQPRGSGPLENWLCGVKDVFALGRTTAGSAILAGFVAQIEATVLVRLRQAGCLFPGKTNLDEFALGSSSETSAFKPTPGCPADRLRVAGGSSGGSAAAVAAGLTRFALGSDTAGSIRVPSSYCGVVGWKPSYGVVSRYGLLPLSMGLDVVGLLTRDVADCARIASVIVGADVRDETTRGVSAIDFPREAEEQRDRKWSVGVPVEYFLNLNKGMLSLYEHLVGTREFDGLKELACQVKRYAEDLPSSDTGSEGHKQAKNLKGLDKFRWLPGYWQRFSRLLQELDAAGWPWRLVSLPHTWLSIPTYFALSRAELASCLHRFDGVTFGTRSDSPSFQDLQWKTRADHFGVQPKIRVLMGIHALRQEQAKESKHIDCDFLKLSKQARWLIQDDFQRVFDKVEILLAPTVSEVAPRYGGIVDLLAQQRLDELTVPANLAGTAALSLPFGRLAETKASHDGQQEGEPLPISLQVISPRFDDARLLATAQRIEELIKEVLEKEAATS